MPEATVWVELPQGFLTFYPKWLGIFSPEIYTPVPSTLDYKFFIYNFDEVKRNHPVHIMLNMFNIGRNAR